MKASFGCTEGLVCRSLSSALSRGSLSLCITYAIAMDVERETPALLGVKYAWMRLEPFSPDTLYQSTVGKGRRMKRIS